MGLDYEGFYDAKYYRSNDDIHCYFLSIDIQIFNTYIYIYMSCIYYNGFDFIYVVILDIQ